MGKFKENYIIQAWLVLLLALFFGTSLAGVELLLGPRIRDNKLNETLELVPGLIRQNDSKKVSGDLKIAFHKIAISRQNREIAYNVLHTSRNDESTGWVIRSTGQGYADKIELLVGFDPNMDSITGLYVLEQKETPGLGNKILESSWREQFINTKTGHTLAAVKTGAVKPGEIDAITGATISSRSVCDIVNTVIQDLKKPLESGNYIQESEKQE